MVNNLHRKTVLLGILVVCSVEVSAMGLFDFMKVCLFSEVNGVVTLEGKPVAGAELTRTAHLEGKVYTDKTVTDDAGVFHFEPLFVNSSMKITSMNPLVPQKINILHNKVTKMGWLFNKKNYDENGEIGKELDLLCDLDDDPENRELSDGAIMHGICVLK